MHDAKVIAACIASRAAYERVRAFVDPSEFTPQGAAWWTLIEQWYAVDPSASAADSGLLRERGARNLPPKHHETLLGWFDALPAASSPENAVLSLIEVKRFTKEQELLHSLTQADRPRKRELIKELDELLAAESLRGKRARLVGYDEMVAATDLSHRIRVAPQALQDRTRGIGPGDVAFIYGRPEIGKSAFAINMVGRFAKDGVTVLYAGNEEDIGKSRLRLTANLCGLPTTSCEANVDKAEQFARKRGIGNVLFYQMEPGNMTEIEELIDEHRPRVVVLDQIRNMTGKGQTMTTRLEENAIQYRVLASRYRFAAIGITQAGDSATNKEFLDQGDVDNSNTGLPGACDLMIGVGATQIMIDTNRRGISLPKNKLGHKHDAFLVTVDFACNSIK